MSSSEHSTRSSFSLTGFAPFSFVMAVFLLTFAIPSWAQSSAAGQKSAAADDVIILTNGDQLTGKLVRADDGKVTFHSDSLGDVTVKWDNVKSLRTAQPFAVIEKGQKITRRTPDSEVPRGTIDVEDNQVQVAPPAGGEAKSLPQKQTQYLIDESGYDKAIHGRLGWRNGWAGTLTAGAALVEATQNSRTFTGGAALARTVPGVDWLAPRYRSSFDFSAAYGSVSSPGTTPTKTNIIHAGLEHDWFVSPRLFFLVTALFDHNYSQGLNLQQIYGAGIGYTLIKTPVQELDLKADVHYGRQSFSPTPGVLPVVINPSKNLIGMDFGDTYMRKLMHGIVFDQGLLVTPAFNDFSAFSALLNAGLNFPVYKNFSFNVAAQDAFLNDPAFGSKKNTFQFIAGVGYTFK